MTGLPFWSIRLNGPPTEDCSAIGAGLFPVTMKTTVENSSKTGEERAEHNEEVRGTCGHSGALTQNKPQSRPE